MYVPKYFLKVPYWFQAIDLLLFRKAYYTEVSVGYVRP